MMRSQPDAGSLATLRHCAKTPHDEAEGKVEG
jgi:hypothetical protein